MKSRQLRLVAMTAAFAACSATTTSASADHRSKWLSDYWNTGRVLKEWLDWRAALGWGTIGAGNVILTATSGASKGDLTKTAVGALCGAGAGAAGVMATWKPLAEPSAASHIKTVVKGASVVAASSTCGWMTHFAFSVIDHGLPVAQRGINGLSLKNTSDLESTMNDVRWDYLAEGNNLEYYNDAVAQAKSALKKVRALGCGGSDDTSQCKKAWDEYDAAAERETSALNEINSYGKALHVDMQHVNHTIGG